MVDDADNIWLNIIAELLAGDTETPPRAEVALYETALGIGGNLGLNLLYFIADEFDLSWTWGLSEPAEIHTSPVNYTFRGFIV